MSQRGYSKATYEAVNARLTAYVDRMVDALGQMFGFEPPFVEVKPPLQRYNDYVALALSGSLERAMQPNLERSESDIQAMADDMARQSNRYSTMGQEHEEE